MIKSYHLDVVKQQQLNVALVLFVSGKKSRKRKLAFVLLTIFSLLSIFYYKYKTYKIIKLKMSYEDEFLFDRIAYEQWFSDDGIKSNNITGFNKMIVPNIIHYILLKVNQISFVHYISIKSVLINHKPDVIMIHCDCYQLNGHYWDKLKYQYKNFNFTIRKVEIRETVFDRKYNRNWHVWHLSDVLRNNVLMEFGGIYLDRDMFVVKSLNDFRKFEMTVAMDHSENTYFGNQIQIGHKRARFLKLYLSLYRDYDMTKWYWNAGIYPTYQIINKYPHLVHRVDKELGVSSLRICQLLYKENSNTWKDEYYSIHLLMKNNSIQSDKWCFPGQILPDKITFNEDDIKTLNITFGQIARSVFYGTTDIIQ